MKVSLNIDSDYEETKVTIESPELDDSVQEILDFIKGKRNRVPRRKRWRNATYSKARQISTIFTQKKMELSLSQPMVHLN